MHQVLDYSGTAAWHAAKAMTSSYHLLFFVHGLEDHDSFSMPV
jgi:hypothetical protein